MSKFNRERAENCTECYNGFTFPKNPNVPVACKICQWQMFEPEPIPDYGDVMTLEEWVEGVEAGALIDYDGHGYYSDGITMIRERLKPSDIYDKQGKVDESKINRSFTHVVWFNR